MLDEMRKQPCRAWIKATYVAMLLASGALPVTGSAADIKVNTTADSVAINGYDTVAYFVDGKATKGSPEYQADWQGARWYFVNAKHQQLFQSDPSHYAPQFGGWCAAGIAEGQYYAVDAETWTIVDGKLYLNYDRQVEEQWRKQRDRNIALAEQAWPSMTKSK